jgi:hypothetical protein
VAPLQKAGIVSLVKKRTADMTLAIGDGMISSVYLFHRLSILLGKKKKRTKHKDKENEKERKITS